jgi:hypothetical protein
MYGSLSNEGRIANGLRQLDCPITVFCKLARIPKTKFLAALDGQPGQALSDETAQKALSFIEKLYNLQLAVDELTRDSVTGKVKHIPIDWSKVDEVTDALVVWQAKEICLETGDHQLDKAAEAALHGVRSVEVS